MAKKFFTEDCPICNCGKWIPYSDGEWKFTHKRKERCVNGLHYSVCNNCGTRGLTEEQAEENKRLVSDFEGGLKDYISPANIRAIRQKYRISQAEAAEIFQCGIAYFSKWERGEVAPTGPAAVLLKNALKDQEFMQRLAKDAGVTVSIPPKREKPEARKIPETPSMRWSNFIDERLLEAIMERTGLGGQATYEPSHKITEQQYSAKETVESFIEPAVAMTGMMIAEKSHILVSGRSGRPISRERSAVHKKMEHH